MIKFFIGIDFSKKTFDATIIERNKLDDKGIHCTFTNSLSGMKQFLSWVVGHTYMATSDDLLFCAEDTGLYSRVISDALSESGYFIWLESALRIKRSLGISRGKNDKKDSRDIAVYASRYQDKATRYVVPDERLEAIKALFMRRRFLKDEDIRSNALNTYHHMIAQLLLPWNQGLYCANPPRCKGWKNLYTGNLSTGVQLVQLTWLFYGSPDERIIYREAANKDNFGCFNFWLAYQRNVKPLPFLQSLNKTKSYPYDFEALRIDSKHYSCRYTYQSHNYGLSTQTIEAFPDKLKDFQYTYAFKETKNIHLVWQSDCSEASVFSVCHDNPERPQIYQSNSNKLGYGENPYHRVFGYGKSAIGIYNVAESYMNLPVFYQMYVPFSRKGIKKRIVKKINGLSWILCHTGSMMFAFATPEDWTFETSGGKYDIKEHDVLILKDKKCRRGSWVLETTEITEQYKDAQGNLKAELEKFAGDIQQKVKFTRSAGYETSDTPGISYTNLQGNTLELTFFSPETAYNGQYKLNGIPRKLNTEYISKSKYMEQKAGSNILLFHTPEGTKSLKME